MLILKGKYLPPKGASFGSKLFLLRVDPFSEGRQNNFDKVASLESVSFAFTKIQAQKVSSTAMKLSDCELPPLPRHDLFLWKSLQGQVLKIWQTPPLQDLVIYHEMWSILDKVFGVRLICWLPKAQDISNYQCMHHTNQGHLPQTYIWIFAEMFGFPKDMNFCVHKPYGLET